MHSTTNSYCDVLWIAVAVYSMLFTVGGQPSTSSGQPPWKDGSCWPFPSERYWSELGYDCKALIIKQLHSRAVKTWMSLVVHGSTDWDQPSLIISNLMANNDHECYGVGTKSESVSLHDTCLQVLNLAKLGICLIFAKSCTQHSTFLNK